MITIKSITFDLNGVVSFQPLADSEESDYRRRFNRIPTLDGGVTVSDGGFSHGDRDLTYNLKPTPQQDSALRYLVQTYSRVHVSTPKGYFAAVMSYTPGPTTSKVTLAITEALA